MRLALAVAAIAGLAAAAARLGVIGRHECRPVQLLRCMALEAGIPDVIVDRYIERGAYRQLADMIRRRPELRVRRAVESCLRRYGLDAEAIIGGVGACRQGGGRG